MQFSNKWYSSANFWHAKGNSIYKAEKHWGQGQGIRGGERTNKDTGINVKGGRRTQANKSGLKI